MSSVVSTVSAFFTASAMVHLVGEDAFLPSLTNTGAPAGVPLEATLPPAEAYAALQLAPSLGATSLEHLRALVGGMSLVRPRPSVKPEIKTMHDAVTLLVKGAKRNEDAAIAQLIKAVEDTPSAFRRKHIPGILKAARQNKEAAYALRLLVVARSDLFSAKDVPAIKTAANRFHSAKLALLFLSIARPEIFLFQTPDAPVFSLKEAARIMEQPASVKNVTAAQALSEDFSPLGLLIVGAIEGNPNKGNKVLVWAKAHPELFGEEEMVLLKKAVPFFSWAESALAYIYING
ncbi:MAG: hypothetical protein Q8P84_08335 [Deltaproteobacteria bacterium]|nr:hypothetical protein [Deltaproteobacteria bacterium]